MQNGALRAPRPSQLCCFSFMPKNKKKYFMSRNRTGAARMKQKQNVSHQVRTWAPNIRGVYLSTEPPMLDNIMFLSP
jgi:hypothetical protein